MQNANLCHVMEHKWDSTMMVFDATARPASYLSLPACSWARGNKEERERWRHEERSEHPLH